MKKISLLFIASLLFAGTLALAKHNELRKINRNIFFIYFTLNNFY